MRSVFVPCFDGHCFVSFLVHEEERAGCFTLFVFLVSCDFYWSVTFPHDAVVWSAVSDCGIS